MHQPIEPASGGHFSMSVFARLVNTLVSENKYRRQDCNVVSAYKEQVSKDKEIVEYQVWNAEHCTAL